MTASSHPVQDRDERIGVICISKLERLVHTLDATIAELRLIQPDAATRARVIESHHDILVELASNVDDDVINEMLLLGLHPIPGGATDDEIRAAHAQLLGWMRGLLAPLVLIPREEP